MTTVIVRTDRRACTFRCAYASEVSHWLAWAASRGYPATVEHP